MSVFTVHEPPLRAADSVPDPERFMFVRDGFYFWAFALTPLWMIWHRMWLVLLIYLIVAVGADSALHYAGIGSGSVVVVELLISFLVGFEASTLRRFTLARRGWKNVGVVAGDGVDAAERRFFDAWAAAANRAGERPTASSAAAAAVDAARAATVRHYRPVSRTGGAALSIAIVDYGSGNLHSAAKAFERAAHDAGIGQTIVVTNDPEAVASADRVVLPGVGAFADCRRGLDAVDGMVAALDDAVRKKGRPFFGICVGMQLLAERGREYEVTEGLGWIAGEVDRITPADPQLKIPHMGWNTLNVTRPHKLVEGLTLGSQGLHAYFVHSYEFKVAQRADLVAEADYGGPLTAIVAHDNIVGTQFHPEKSQKLGLAVIANFLKWKP